MANQENKASAKTHKEEALKETIEEGSKTRKQEFYTTLSSLKKPQITKISKTPYSMTPACWWKNAWKNTEKTAQT